MNYKAIYDALIERARQRELKDVYFEKHHVIPKCMGGSNKKDNMVQLLAREHFIAHELLIKIYPDNYELICALNLMCNFDKYVMTSRKYEWVRIKFAEQHSKRMSGENNGMFGKHHSEETRNKQSIAKKDYVPWIKGQKHSEETIKNMSQKKKGTKRTAESKKKQSISLAGTGNHFFGKHHSEETKKKISDRTKGRVVAEEVKQKISKSLSGNNNPNYGTHLTEERKQKQSEKMSGINHPRYGKKDSVEVKKNKSESAKKTWERRKANKN